MHAGTALFTMGTKGMTEQEEERSGLAEKHAYAVLDVAEACGRRLVKLKNPWANLRWKGALCIQCIHILYVCMHACMYVCMYVCMYIGRCLWANLR